MSDLVGQGFALTVSITLWLITYSNSQPWTVPKTPPHPPPPLLSPYRTKIFPSSRLVRNVDNAVKDMFDAFGKSSYVW